MSSRFPFIAMSVFLAGCASVPATDGNRWHGRAEGRVEVWLHSANDSPGVGWLVKSDETGAAGFVRYKKWWPGDMYSYAAPFVVETAWREGVDHIGLIKANGSGVEFCTLNPEHGAFIYGDSIVHTYSWDYCAQLTRR